MSHLFLSRNIVGGTPGQVSALLGGGVSTMSRGAINTAMREGIYTAGYLGY
jgi:hypothetical protein